MATLVLPGDVVGSLESMKPGPGTYVDAKASVIRASVSGRIATIDLGSLGLEVPLPSDSDASDEKGMTTSSSSSASSAPASAASSSSSSEASAMDAEAEAGGKFGKPIVFVEPPHSPATAAVPAEGDIVIGRVIGVGDRQVEIEVLVLGAPGRALRSSMRGSVRKEDVRSTDVDRVVMLQSMRPGDIVRARVLSLGDRRALFLSTAEAELGVIWARSRAGHIMIPAAHDSMRCPVSGEDEPRKVARYEF
jgi:exosome complex component CSL4